LAEDLLAGASWECCGAPPGALPTQADLEGYVGPWFEVSVPGTVALGLARADHVPAPRDLDEWDWWFRCNFARPGSDPGPWALDIGGLATVADVWLNGSRILHGENMFVSTNAQVDSLQDQNELAIRFLALSPLLRVRRPRPRWKTMQATHQALRWFRTSLVGRQPGYVEVPPAIGPWRPLSIRRPEPLSISKRRLTARCEGDGGVVEIEAVARLDGPRPDSAYLRVGEREGALEVVEVRGSAPTAVVRGSLSIDRVERWWPHTHGGQRLYPVSAVLDGRAVELGHVGFRDIELDRADDGFRFVVNGVPVFCRGACWWPVDAVSMAASAEEVRTTLELAKEANMNMLRIPGGTTYENKTFWDFCDQMGFLVWQDCMLGYFDPPEEPTFVDTVVSELDEVFAGLGGRPALAVVCGGQEIEEQAAYFGLPREKRYVPLVSEAVPKLVAEALPGVPYVTSSPSGGALPFEADAGDCHYWGIGSLLRGLEDPRRCGIRFMSEGLGLGTPPERTTVDTAFGTAAKAAHDPQWKRAVHHDTARSWDLDDVRDYYVAKVFDLDPHMLRYLDPERALDVGRATNAELFSQVMSEWRRPESPCWGALVVALRDFVPGPGWGVLDSSGLPKSVWYVMKRVLAAVSVFVTDEGMNGLHFHVANDTSESLECRLAVELFTAGASRPEEEHAQILVPARSAISMSSSSVFDGFRDIGYTYRYGPVGYDAVVGSLRDASGTALAEVVHLPMGQSRAYEDDVGLEVRQKPLSGEEWSLEITTQRLAQWVHIDVPGFRPDDSWFHLVPGRAKAVVLVPSASAAGAASGPAGAQVVGQVRALNSRKATTVVLEAES
jgi:beta-mannosidase